MRDMLVLTVLGADRTGLVESLAKKIAAVGGNWEDSRMARLGGQFAGILLVTVETARTDELVASLRELDAQGLQVTARPTAAPAKQATRSVRLVVTGQDRPGIVRDVARVLVERGANVEELESTIAPAPMSGERMFTAKIRAAVAAAADTSDLRARLEALGGEVMVDFDA
jgi:glycine cleavage system regulatory protein